MIVNEELKYLCKAKKTDFIDHFSIDGEKHLNNSKIHLNIFGTIAFAKDFLNYLKHWHYPEENIMPQEVVDSESEAGR